MIHRLLLSLLLSLLQNKGPREVHWRLRQRRMERGVWQRRRQQRR